MTRVVTRLALFGILAWAGCATPQGASLAAGDPGPMIQPEEPVSVSRALFTETQAERGREAFREICSECHYSSEFRDAQFDFAWKRRTVWDLYREISRTMPDDNPGGLAEQQYLDVVSYILSINDFPAGQAELVADEDRLDAVSMAPPSGAP